MATLCLMPCIDHMGQSFDLWFLLTTRGLLGAVQSIRQPHHRRRRLLQLFSSSQLNISSSVASPPMHTKRMKGLKCVDRSEVISVDEMWSSSLSHFTGRTHRVDGQVICPSEHSAQNRDEVNGLLRGSILHLSLCMVISLM